MKTISNMPTKLAVNVSEAAEMIESGFGEE